MRLEPLAVNHLPSCPESGNYRSDSSARSARFLGRLGGVRECRPKGVALRAEPDGRDGVSVWDQALRGSRLTGRVAAAVLGRGRARGQTAPKIDVSDGGRARKSPILVSDLASLTAHRFSSSFPYRKKAFEILNGVPRAEHRARERRQERGQRVGHRRLARGTALPGRPASRELSGDARPPGTKPSSVPSKPRCRRLRKCRTRSSRSSTQGRARRPRRDCEGASDVGGAVDPALQRRYLQLLRSPGGRAAAVSRRARPGAYATGRAGRRW